ncbi:MAG TPA: HlyD family efflux transporter periplasmic adaptor subunit [Bryobacteraceae bacterium]
MGAPFSRSTGWLDSDGFRGSLWWLGIALALIGAWTAWLFLARIERYEVTDKARLEVDRAAHVLQAPVAGRVVVSAIDVGRAVKAGEVLVQLDAGPQELELREARARLAALGPQIDAARSELAAIGKAQQAESEATVAAEDVARAQVREGKAMADLAREEATRQERLTAEGLAPEKDAARSKAEAQSREASTESLQLGIARLERERAKNAGDREAAATRLRGDIARMDGERATLARTIDRLAYEVERRKIRAPLAGRFGEAPVLRVGAYLVEGQALGAIVPDGRVRVIAEFPPAAALGRIRPGQPARMRLDGFPWAQYGAVPATVETVAGEVRDGTVRVELAPDASPSLPVPMQHGLPGSVEVRVERVAPVALALRAAGQFIASPRSPYSAAEPSR